MAKNKSRLSLIDFIRGVAVINMILYHALWDTVYIFGEDIPLFKTQWAYLWQQCICWCFIFLSGFSMNLGRKSYKRGALVFAGGLAVTAVTLIAMPENRIVFGVLTLLGSCMLIMTALGKITEKIKPSVGFILSMLLLVLTRNINKGFLGFETIRLAPLPKALYSGYVSTFFGFTADGFYSADYFSLIPWIFLFAAGYFAFHIIKAQGRLKFAQRSISAVVEFIGKQSLWIYLAHQPIIYLMLTIIYSI